MHGWGERSSGDWGRGERGGAGGRRPSPLSWRCVQCEVRRAKATMSTRWLSTFQDPPLVSSPSHPSASTLYSRPLSELSFTFKKLPVTARDSLHGCVSISRLGYMFQLISLIEAYSLRNQLFCPAWHKASGSPSSLRSELLDRVFFFSLLFGWWAWNSSKSQDSPFFLVIITHSSGTNRLLEQCTEIEKYLHFHRLLWSSIWSQPLASSFSS